MILAAPMMLDDALRELMHRLATRLPDVLARELPSFTRRNHTALRSTLRAALPGVDDLGADVRGLGHPSAGRAAISLAGVGTARDMDSGMTGKLAATCAYCLRRLTRLHRGSVRPVRHGFAINCAGDGRGHRDARHSGPCKGARYPHLGASMLGAEVGLADARQALAQREATLGELAQRPPLAWSREELTTVGGVVVRPELHVELRSGERHPNRSVPSYDDVLALRTEQIEDEAAAFRTAISALETALANWAPADPVEVP